jgi:integrase/recombinase XerC
MIEDKITDFGRYLKFEKRYAQHTLTAYNQDLEQFRSFIKQQFDITDIKPVAHFHLRSWLADLKDNKQTERTINRKISSVNSFFKYLLKQQLVEKNPVREMHALRLPERLPQYMKEQETEHLLEEVPFDIGFKGATDRLICELFYQTGMRRAELQQLKENDIEWKLRQVRILGKGNKERLVPLSPDLLEAIKAYIAEKGRLTDADGNLLQSDSSHLLVLENGKPLYPEYIYRIVKKYLSVTTTLKKKSPHILRHTFATHLLNNGANIQAIKDLLGHSSLAATQVYTHNNIERLKEIHKTRHPRG